LLTVTITVILVSDPRGVETSLVTNITNMKTLKNFFRKLFIYTAIAAGIIAIVLAGVKYMENKNSVTSYHVNEATSTEITQVAPQGDVTDEAQQAIIEANKKLDAKEKSILGEIEAASSTYHAILNQKNAELDKINKVRSFK